MRPRSLDAHPEMYAGPPTSNKAAVSLARSTLSKHHKANLSFSPVNQYGK